MKYALRLAGALIASAMALFGAGQTAQAQAFYAGKTITVITSSGVMTTPSRVESVALSTAAAMSPRASAVIATDDDTVDGSAAK